MEESSYTGLGQKKLRRFNLRVEEGAERLLEIAKKDLLKLNQESLVLGFCEDLKYILEQDSLPLMIDAFFELEGLVRYLEEQMAPDSEIEIPHLKNLYSHLSPLLMRGLWENLEDDQNVDNIFQSWVEAIRISIEEEIYFWQDDLSQTHHL